MVVGGGGWVVVGGGGWWWVLGWWWVGVGKNKEISESVGDPLSLLSPHKDQLDCCKGIPSCLVTQ